MSDMLDTTNKEICKSCHYGKKLMPYIVCDFFLMTGKRRGCSIGVCDKYKPIDGKRKRNSFVQY